LGRLVRDGKIRTLEEIYLFSLPIKVEYGWKRISLLSNKVPKYMLFSIKCARTMFYKVPWDLSLTSRYSHLYCYFCRMSLYLTSLSWTSSMGRCRGLLLYSDGYPASPTSIHQCTINVFLTS
jgi:hypothetical protein